MTAVLFTSGLRGEALRAMARNLFPAFYERGLSANEALRTLREMGLGYRRQDFLRDYAQGKGEWQRGTSVRFVNKDAVPSDSIMNTKYHGVPDKYSFLARIEYTDVYGQRQVMHRWYHTDTKGTIAELEDRIAQRYSDAERYPISINRVVISRADINPYWEEF